MVLVDWRWATGYLDIMNSMKRLVGVSEEELQQEIEGMFEVALSVPLLPSHLSLAANFKFIRLPATNEDIARLPDAWRITLPASYLDFLRESDGAAGCASDHEGDYLTLWGIEELIERNAYLPIRRTLPDVLAIGTDGRGGWVGFVRTKSQEAEQGAVLCWDVGSSLLSDMREVATNFKEWRKDGFQIRPCGSICAGG
jgi:hypothetical protein